MIAVVQRVSAAAVEVDGKVVGEIGAGLLALVAVEVADGPDEIAWMSQKLIGLRIFRAGEKHFDADVTQIPAGGILLVSNFTVAAETRKGRRPSLDGAAAPAVAAEMFEKFVQQVRNDAAGKIRIETGVFGGDMRVNLTNDGPATFIVRTEPKA